ncbi:MAG: hypothetical protein V8T87_13175 [Victivallales bacterium]
MKVAGKAKNIRPEARVFIRQLIEIQVEAQDSAKPPCRCINCHSTAACKCPLAD